MDAGASIWNLPLAAAAFAIAGAAIAYFGSRLTRVVDRLADRTGMGEAIAGAVLLASATSIAGLIVTVTAAVRNNPSLAIGNAVGGIAAQTAFIVVADAFYRRANLERAAASITNIFSTILMMSLLSVVILGVATPSLSVLGVHPSTPLLFAVYGYGLWLSREVGERPMWLPERTVDTKVDEPEEAQAGETLPRLWGSFLGLAAVVAATGWVVARAGLFIVDNTALTGTFVGAFFTAVVTSLPELVTSIAAVRTGALTLAIGGIVGGNTFDVLFLAVADVAFRDGAIYAGADLADIFVLGWTMLMTGVLGAGLLRRQPGRIGFEGTTIIAVYITGLVVLASTG